MVEEELLIKYLSDTEPIITAYKRIQNETDGLLREKLLTEFFIEHSPSAIVEIVYKRNQARNRLKELDAIYEE